MRKSPGFFPRISLGQLCHNKRIFLQAETFVMYIKKKKKTQEKQQMQRNSKVFPCINNNASEGFQAQSWKSGDVFDQTRRSRLDSTCPERRIGEDVPDSTETRKLSF